MNFLLKLLVLNFLVLVIPYRAFACPINANFIFGSTELRIGDAVLFTNTSTNANAYAWYVNNVLMSNAQHYTHTFANVGTYTIRLQATNTSCSPTLVSSTKIVEVTNTNIGGTKVGLPVFPMAVIGNIKAQSIDWRYSLPQKDSIPNTLVNGGQTGAAFDGCGNIAFFVLHTGSSSANNLFIYRPDGTALLNSAVNAPGLNGVKGYQEIQVIPVPTVDNEWYIIYKKWASDVGSQNSNAMYAATNWLYSRVRYVNNVFTVLSRDVTLMVGGVAQVYTDGAAVSRTVPNVPNAHYLYLCRRTLGTSTTASVDRFIINASGITFHQNSGAFTGLPSFTLALSYSPLELSPTEDKLAVITRNETQNDIDIILLNTNTFTVASSQLLSIDRMLLRPDGQAGDLSSVNNVLATPLTISTSNSQLYFLRNIGKKVSDIEFSPNGKYLYFVGGGFQQSAHMNLTYLGQIDLTSNTPSAPNVYHMRLQIQTTPGNTYDATTGLGCNFQTVCINQSRHINAIESAYDGNLYFAKSQNSILYVIPRPNEDLPQNLVPSDIDLSTAQEPNHHLLAGHINTFPDQIDGFNYLSDDYIYLKAFFGKYNCTKECVAGGTWQLVEVGNSLNTINFTSTSCFQEIEVCVHKSKTYNLVDLITATSYNNIIINGVLQYNAKSMTGITGYQVSLNQTCIEICGNGVDDDGDGLVDCLDGDCCGYADCLKLVTSPCRPDTTSCLFDDCSHTPGSFACKIPEVVKAKLDFKTLNTHYVNEFANVLIGDIDNDTIVEMIAFTKNGSGYAFNGTTGALKYTYNTGVVALGDIYDVYPCMGDVNNDGKTEIFIMRNNRIISYNFDGSMRWSKSVLTMPSETIMGGLYDLNQDGIPELVYGNHIFNARNGELLLVLPNTHTYGKTIDNNVGGLIAVADVMPSYYCEYCEGLEIIAGNKVYAIDLQNINSTLGNTYFLVSEIAGYTDGATSIADVNNDGQLDIIVATKNNIGNKGILVWNPREQNAIFPFYTINSSSDNTPIGRVTMIDINANNRPEFFVTINEGTTIKLIALSDNLGAIKWQKTWVTPSITNYAPGVTVYDLNNDEQYEVIYRDQANLNIINAETGTNIDAMPCSSRGGINYPVVTNMPIYEEGQIICTCKEGTATDDNSVITVFKSNNINVGWKRARKVWNQHAYNYVNVNDNLTIPSQITNAANYRLLNNFNVAQSNEIYQASNTEITTLYDSFNASTGELTVTFTYCNHGTARTDIPTYVWLKPHLRPSILDAPIIDVKPLIDIYNQPIRILPKECKTFSLVYSYPDYLQATERYHLVYGDYHESCCCIPGAKSVPAPPPGVLPLDDIYFTARKSFEHKKSSILDWRFMAENPQDYTNIQIERSNDAVNFEILANTIAPNAYTFIDNRITSNLHYYRLKVTENNAEAFYTHIQAVRFDDFQNNINIYPNPFTHQIQIEIPQVSAGENYSFELYDLLGRQLQHETYTTTEGAQIYILKMNENLAPANYILKINMGDMGVRYFKLQKQE